MIMAVEYIGQEQLDGCSAPDAIEGTCGDIIGECYFLAVIKQQIDAGNIGSSVFDKEWKERLSGVLENYIVQAEDGDAPCVEGLKELLSALENKSSK